jgi:predicted transcriptional regulator
MPFGRFQRNSKGFEEILKSPPVAKAVHDLAEAIAADVSNQVDADQGVVVDDYQTDRAASSITIRDAAGKLWEARDGVLTRAASRQGLEVHREA